MKIPNTDKIESLLLMDIYQRLNSKKESLMDSKIPLMILAYFETHKPTKDVFLTGGAG